MRRFAFALTALAALAAAGFGSGCASAQEPPAREDAAAEAAVQEEGLIPAGFGTLKQDQFTVSMRSGPLLIKVTPLDESVIRLAAPDTYQKLHALAESRRADLPAGAPAELFLVTLFSYEPDVTYTPEDLQLTSLGRFLRPARILPVTPGWSRQRLAQQEMQMAIYVFDEPIRYDQPLTIRFGMEQNDAWTRLVPLLETERGKARARAAS